MDLINILSDNDIKNLREWNYSVEDNSIITQIFTPFWNKIATFIPSYIAPNLISLCGLLCLIMSTIICNFYIDIDGYETIVKLLSIMLIIIYTILDAIDGKHARNIKNATQLGEFFDHTCDSIGIIFLVITFCKVIGIKDIINYWYIMNIVYLLFLECHSRAYKNLKVVFNRFTGPYEGISFLLILMIIQTYFKLNLNIDKFRNVVEIVFLVVLIFTFITIIVKHKNLTLAAIIFIITFTNKSESLIDLISYGSFYSVIVSDLILAKMTKRNIHPILLPLSFISYISYISIDNYIAIFFYIFISAIYYINVFNELCWKLNLPLLTTVFTHNN
jgi:phosphatidylglycerophosphate synthase